jgi:transcriptional regulator with XRE-family HTH domain
MPTSSDDDQFTASLRAKLHSSQVDSGRSLSELCQSLGVESVELMRDYFSGKADMPVSLLFRYSRLVGRPIWWFFGEQPATISVESAETALGNISRLRLYVDALEAEFRLVLGQTGAARPARSGAPLKSSGATGEGPVVVDFAPYLSRARAILEREAEFTEDSEEVFEESVEMIAHSLYSIEMAQHPSREFHSTEL